MVQLPFDLCNILVRQILEVRTLGDILPCETVGVLIGASLPGVVRSGKEELDIQYLRYLLSPCVLQTLSLSAWLEHDDIFISYIYKIADILEKKVKITIRPK